VAPLTTDYRDSAIELVNNGHTVQASYDAGSGIDLDGQRFALRQFHFHAPSEHTVQGRSFPAEIHFVHESPEGGLVVIGAFVDVGSRNHALAPVLDNLPTTVDLPREVLNARVSAAAILGAAGGSVRYDGSLTTPPCTEGVRWIVLAQALQLDEAQLDQIRGVAHENSRPVQPVQGRPIASVMLTTNNVIDRSAFTVSPVDEGSPPPEAGP
jgi:carbonic anhydrase